MATAPFTILQPDDAVDVYHLVGEIDLATSHLLSTAISSAMAAGALRIVLDFAEVTFVNSTGLGAMVAATKALRAQGGDLVLRNFQGIPTALLATTGLDQFFTLET